MAHFLYHATDAAGKLIKGSLEAKDRDSLVDKLHEMGYFPVRIGSSSDEKKEARKNSGFTLLRRKASANLVVGFTQELSDMLESGLALDRSLSILAELEKNDAFKKVIIEVHKDIQAGEPFADALEKHPHLFSEIYINTVRAGEAGGSLEIVLSRLKKFIEDARRLKEDIKSALIYPMLLILVGGSAVALMLMVFIPKFSVILEDMGGVMPLPTQILLNISGTLTRFWPLIIILIAASLLGFKAILKTEEGRVKFDRLKLRIPLFGPILRKAAVSRFSRTLGALMQGGLPILESLKIAVRTIGNSYMTREISPAIDGVRRGRGLTEPLKETSSFPALAIHMLAVGEETGKLDETLIRLSDKYDRDVGTAVKRLLSLLEPVIILVMAVLVGFVVISLMLAVFSLNDMPM
ncbi:MAG: type II secretion system F family protein [Thermodesulfobacteriota bacterium]